MALLFYPFRGLRAEGPKRKTTSDAGGSQKASSTEMTQQA